LLPDLLIVVVVDDIKIRSTKSEIRNKLKIQISKFLKQRIHNHHNKIIGCFEFLSFGIRICFRISRFEFRIYSSVKWNCLRYHPYTDFKGLLMGKVFRDYEVYLVYVDADRCDSCKECVLMCPTEVFEMPHKAIPVRPQNCLGCLTCTAVCKSKAIIITEI